MVLDSQVSHSIPPSGKVWHSGKAPVCTCVCTCTLKPQGLSRFSRKNSTCPVTPRQAMRLHLGVRGPSQGRAHSPPTPIRTEANIPLQLLAFQRTEDWGEFLGRAF